jgi:hypothetical protein
MALLDDVTKNMTSPTGLAIGIGTLILAPIVVPAVTALARPLAKTVLSTGIGLYRQTMEPLGRAVTDLVTEARAEMAQASAGSHPGTEVRPEDMAGAKPQRGSRKGAEA